MANKIVLKPTATYKCEQNELYGVYLMGYGSFHLNIPAFASYRPMYNEQYYNDRMADLLAAGAIPGFHVRYSPAEVFRIQLMDKTDQCTTKWLGLKGYITGGFPKNLVKTMLEEAGIKYYEQAANYNWEKVANLMGDGSNFMVKHLAELTANGNMSATFQAEYNQLKNEATVLYTQFQTATDEGEQLTFDKINANNDIHAKLMKMFKDGQYVFRNDPVRREQFTFTKVLERVRGASTAYKEFEVPKNSSIIIKKIVEDSLFMNIGDVSLVFCNGDVSCTPETGFTVGPEATTVVQEGVKTITVVNSDPILKGRCKVRVVKK